VHAVDGAEVYMRKYTHTMELIQKKLNAMPFVPFELTLRAAPEVYTFNSTCMHTP
jgi:hypothetical protein